MAHRKPLIERRASQISKHLNGHVSYAHNRDGSIDVYVPTAGVVVVLAPGAGEIWPLGCGRDCAAQSITARVARDRNGAPMHSDDGKVREILGRALKAVASIEA